MTKNPVVWKGRGMVCGRCIVYWRGIPLRPGDPKLPSRRSEEQRATRDEAADSLAKEHGVAFLKAELDLFADLAGNTAKDDAGQEKITDSNFGCRFHPRHETLTLSANGGSPRYRARRPVPFMLRRSSVWIYSLIRLNVTVLSFRDILSV